LYHLAGSERLSRWEIGQLLAAYWAPLEVKMERASIRDFRGLPRSPDTSLDCGKMQQLLSFPLPRFGEWLRKSKA
jgi:dTDP-4-dehydrorhamnose reductase